MLTNLSRSYSLPWFSALQIACLTLAAALHQRPDVLRPVVVWLERH